MNSELRLKFPPAERSHTCSYTYYIFCGTIDRGSWIAHDLLHLHHLQFGVLYSWWEQRHALEFRKRNTSLSCDIISCVILRYSDQHQCNQANLVFDCVLSPTYANQLSMDHGPFVCFLKKNIKGNGLEEHGIISSKYVSISNNNDF